MEMGAKWWPSVEPHLEDEDHEAYKALYLSERDLTDEMGFDIVGVDETDYLWKKWLDGKGPAPFRDREGLPLWKLSKKERVLRKLLWQKQIYTEKREELANAMVQIEEARNEIWQLQDQNHEEVLRTRRVIGVTTTKAAMMKDLLDSVAPGIVMIEEAGEVLEAHVLTSISPGCERLIMIGDHKQLRPKCEFYPLTCEAGRGHNLNCSLFERLATKLPIATLSTQWRMHPEISAIAKQNTYPELIDADVVSDHPPVRGIPKRVTFVDHFYPEDGADNLADGTEAVSKSNAYEVGMVVATVKYLLQQGYQPTDLVILTPYLGQVLRIQQALSGAKLCALIGDLDLKDAYKRLDGAEGFDVQAAASLRDRDSGIRVATIDNYQGEEADVAVISLVRGSTAALGAAAEDGKRTSIGFLKEPQRVNVLFTRAKHGMVVFGNRVTLERAGGEVWRSIYGLMDEGENVSKGVLVKCKTHQTQQTLETPEDFTKHCPGGGCSKICKKKLTKCEHSCTLKCHPFGPCLKYCKVKVNVKCLRGDHDMTRECSAGKPPTCNEIVYWKCNGRKGATHYNESRCFEINLKCYLCDKIEELKKKEEQELKKMKSERIRWSKDIENRRLEAELAKELQECKQRDFEDKKKAELDQKRLEIQLNLHERAQKMREEHAGIEIEDQVRKMHEKSEQDIARLVKQIQDQLANRAQQAQEAIEKIEHDRMMYMQKKLIDQEAIEAEHDELIRLCQEQLDVAHAANEEDVRRLKAEHAAIRQQLEQEAAEAKEDLESRRAELQASEHAAVERVRENRDRLRRLGAAEKRIIDEKIAAADGDMEAQSQLAERLRDCLVCCEEIRAVDGYICQPEGHFLCDECFKQQVVSQSCDELRKLEARNGIVVCAFCRPEDAANIGAGTILQHAGNEGFNAYMNASKKVIETKLSKEIHEEEKKRFATEQERLAKMDEKQRKVHRHCLHVREELLTLKCPRQNCRQAFLDFDGCFALTCDACGCGFCAWCLEDCGEDAHAHVAACPDGQGGYHGEYKAFNEAQRKRRLRVVREYLVSGGMDDEIRKSVVEQCRKDFEDLQLMHIVDEFCNAVDGRDFEVDEELALGLQYDEVDWYDEVH
jgi:hypothetical protein